MKWGGKDFSTRGEIEKLQHGVLGEVDAIKVMKFIGFLQGENLLFELYIIFLKCILPTYRPVSDPSCLYIKYGNTIPYPLSNEPYTSTWSVRNFLLRK